MSTDGSSGSTVTQAVVEYEQEDPGPHQRCGATITDELFPPRLS
jgi:hypothetical protein